MLLGRVLLACMGRRASRPRPGAQHHRRADPAVRGVGLAAAIGARRSARALPAMGDGRAWIAGLPPYGALLALAVPSVILDPGEAARRLPAGHRPLHHRGRRDRRRQSRLDGAHRPHLPADQAGADADRVVRATPTSVFVPWQEALFARIRASWVWRYGRIVKWRAEQYVRASLAAAAPAARSAWRDVRPRMAAVRWVCACARSARLWARVSPRRDAPSRADCRRPTRRP